MTPQTFKTVDDRSPRTYTPKGNKNKMVLASQTGMVAIPVSAEAEQEERVLAHQARIQAYLEKFDDEAKKRRESP